jgi:SNF2 family DNA or RNA helicase
MRGNTPHLKFKNGKDDNHTFYNIKFPKDALVIVDEVHKCKGWNSKNSDFLIACKTQGYKLLVLSATAATNPLEMKSFGFATLLHTLGNFREFLFEAGAFKSRFGGYQIDLTSDKTQQAMRYMHEDLFNNLGVAGRMTIKQFGTIFPDNRVVADCFDMGSNTAKIQKVYDLMERELAQLEESSKNYKEHQFAIMTKARRMAELLKVPTMVEMIEDLYDEGISPVVFVNYTETVDALRTKLLKNSKLANQLCFIIGGQSEKARNENVDAFQSNTRRIMIANLAAGNAGISLHDLVGGYMRHSIVSPSFSAIHLVQALGRIHRAEGKSPCIQKILFAADTIEEHACRRVQARINNLDMLNDADLTSGIKLV